LGQFLAPDRRVTARTELTVRVRRLAIGPVIVSAEAVDPAHLGLLVLDGVLSRELLADEVASLELLAPGDVVRPWQPFDDSGLPGVEDRWNVLAEVRAALLDAETARRLGQYPEIYRVLIERLTERAQRLAVMQMISQLNRVARRVLTLLWHLAATWGRVTPDGVLIPLALSHRLLAQLVGARRPTVSTAISELVRAGDIARNPDGTWLLLGESARVGEAPLLDYVRPRRRVLPIAPAYLAPSVVETA
jgi:hypothetical protein